jgi:hypothetical protein
MQTQLFILYQSQLKMSAEFQKCSGFSSFLPVEKCGFLLTSPYIYATVKGNQI